VFLCAWKGTPSGPGPRFAPRTFLNGFGHHATLKMKKIINNTH
jgi:hypothetical protein